MKILLSILLLFSFAAKAQDTTKYMPMSAKGYKFNGGTFKNIWIGQDTTNYKTGIVRIGFRFFVGNGVYWKEIAGTDDSLKVDSVKIYSSSCVDTLKYWVSGTATTVGTFDKTNGLNSGGEVTLGANDTTFNVASAVYKLSCVRYASSGTSVVLNGNADTLGRFDVIGVNTSSAVFALQGTPAANPTPPSLNPATQIGLATIYFPPLSDSGQVNIYNITNASGVDSSAYWTASVLSDSTGFILCDRRGRCDTIISTERAASIDSLRRIAGSTNVQARKGGVWVTQYQDSVGSGGGGSQNLDQVLTVGNNTDTTINFVDTLSSNEGKQFVTIYPKGYGQTGYPNGRPAMFSGLGYYRYPGVNADGRPNVVGLLWGYNGGFNNKVIAGEPTWGVRTETWYQISGQANSEFHGVSPEFQPINGTASRRLGTWYVRNSDGYSTFTSQGDNYKWFRGASDTVQFSSETNRFNIGFKTAGNFTMSIGDSGVSNHFNINKGLNSTSFSISTASPAAAAVSYMDFASPIKVSTSATYGTTNSSAISAQVGIANFSGFKVIQSGLSTSNFEGYESDVSTTGTFSHNYGRQLGTGGTIESWFSVGNTSTAQYALSDVANGTKWRMYLKAGDAEKQMKIGFGTSTYDSLMKFRGTDGKVSIRTSLNVGAAAYPVASAALEVTSTTQGFLPPRMTATQASAISSPAEGLLVYVTNTNGTFTAKGWWGWDGAAWQKLNN